MPTRHNCPECSDQYQEYRQSQTNRRSIRVQDTYHHNMDRRLKNKSIHDRLGKRVVGQDWADHEEGSNQRKHVWQEGQWCPRGLTRSQKRRVQRLRNKEMEQAQASSKTQVWHTKQIADRKQPSANIQMAFLLPSEFRAPANQEVYLDFDESEYEEIVAKLTVIQQTIFDKPVKHQHLKALYVKGFVDGKPMNKMLVDEGASVNLMPYTTFRKLGKGPGDLIELT